MFPPITIPELRGKRAIIHLDLDCFYCQVEQVRLGIPREVPAAVQQWNGLIAVNYAARAYGISRNCTPAEAREKCPEIKLLHVATFAGNDTQAAYHANPSMNTHKASLDPYRQASRRIFSILREMCQVVQKAGTDEGFLDVTQEAKRRLITSLPPGWRPGEGPPRTHWSSDVCRIIGIEGERKGEEGGVSMKSSTQEVNGKYDDPTVDKRHGREKEKEEEEEEKGEKGEERENASLSNPNPTPVVMTWTREGWEEALLWHASEISMSIRERLLRDLGYTAGAGIAGNKVLAKLCSAKYKPNQQSVIFSAQGEEFIAPFPLDKIRLLGGKLGLEVKEAFGVETAQDLRAISLPQLRRHFSSKTAKYLYDRCRGVCDDAVKPNDPTSQTMSAGKQFKPALTSSASLSPWIPPIAGDLWGRAKEQLEEYNVWPNSMSVHVIGWKGSLQRGFPSTRDPRGVGALVQEIKDALFPKVPDPSKAVLPCQGLYVTASKFETEEGLGARNIQSFFSLGPSSGREEMSPQGKMVGSTLENVMEVTKGVKDSKGEEMKGHESKLFAQPTQQCIRCQPARHILMVEWEEHQDWHLAMQLHQDQLKRPHLTSSPSPSLKGMSMETEDEGDGGPMGTQGKMNGRAMRGKGKKRSVTSETLTQHKEKEASVKKGRIHGFFQPAR